LVSAAALGGFCEREAYLRKAIAAAVLAMPLLAAPALAVDPQPDPDLAAFRAAYTSGDGLSYVVIKDDKGEHIYRYGDASRLTAKKNPRGYMLFTCNAPHVFVPEKPEHKAALAHAEVVKSGDSRFAELDAKYLAGCHNPLVKSAIPKNRQSTQ
jgi:hypothetical protein